MEYERSNVGLGMVPCRKGCGCNECTIEKLNQHIKNLTMERNRLITWIENVATDDQLDTKVPMLGDITGRQLFSKGDLK